MTTEGRPTDPTAEGLSRLQSEWRRRRRGKTSSPSRITRITRNSSQPHSSSMPTEALTTKIEGPELDPTESNTAKTQQHEACSYSYVVVRCDGETEPPMEYRGPNAAEHFLQALQEEERTIKGVLANPKAMRMTPEEWQAHNPVTTCLQDQAGDSVRDHCHITGKYRGAAHSACNLKLRLNPKTMVVPVVFHNLRSYDSHLLMQAISKVKGKVSCIPNNTEKYITFSLG